MLSDIRLPLIVSLLPLFLFPAAAWPAGEIQFLTHSIKGYTHIDSSGELRGNKKGGKRAFNVELVRAMMLLVGAPAKFIEIPFKMGFRQVRVEPDLAFFNVSKTPEREHFVKWVGPLQLDISYLYEMKEYPTHVRTMEDAKKVDSICVLRGGIHYNLLLDMGFTNLVENDSYVQCFQMLAQNRVNLTPSAQESLPGKLQQARIQQERIRQTPVLVSKVEGYIAFSNNISDSVVEKWQNALNQLKQSGKYQQLYNEYFLP